LRCVRAEWVDNAVFDRAVEPAESLVGVGYLALQ